MVNGPDDVYVERKGRAERGLKARQRLPSGACVKSHGVTRKSIGLPKGA